MNTKLSESMNKSMADSLKKEVKKEESHIGHKEFKAMKMNSYKDNEADDSYVIENKKTGAIVEIKAKSAFMAAKTVGWRPRHTRLVQVHKASEKEG
mgnify:CR=1 FL=1